MENTSKFRAREDAEELVFVFKRLLNQYSYGIGATSDLVPSLAAKIFTTITDSKLLKILKSLPIFHSVRFWY